MAVIALFVIHWQLSVFCQSFFLHRYGAHQQFTMSRGWEKFFNILTSITQNSSYLNPRGYAILHRMHHAYSDTERDPHSPVQYRGLFPGLFADDVPDQAHLSRAGLLPETARAPLRRRLPQLAPARMDGQELDDADRLGRQLRGVLLVLRHRELAVVAAAGALDHGRGPRGDRELVGTQVRLPELPAGRSLQATPCRWIS